MRELVIPSVLFIFIIGLISSCSRAEEDIDQYPSELIVKFKDSTTREARQTAHRVMGALRWRRSYRDAFEVVAFRQNMVDRAMARYRLDPQVEYVEPNYRRRASWTPDEPDFGTFWNLHAINIAEAWEYSRGAGVIVAIVDSGITSGGADGFQYPLLPGYNFVAGNTDTTDDEGHGTFVAGVVAQYTNNTFGSAGVAPEVSLMPVKVLDSAGRGRTSAIADGIRWAADNGAKVINISLGGRRGSRTERRAISYAHQMGCLITAAAGNSGSRRRIDSPAKYREAIAVGAIEADLTLARYSNSGRSLDVVAPGGNIYVDRNDDGELDGIYQETLLPGTTPVFYFDHWQGTSMAAPHVAGLAALLFEVHSEWSNTQVRQRIESTCQDLGSSGRDRQYGHGLIDAAAALSGP